MKNPRSVIQVLHYNTFEKTKNCIDSCLAQKGVDFDVILVDNASTDGSLEKLEALFAGKIQVLKSRENWGFAKGNNLGVRFSHDRGYRYCLLLNSDTVLQGEYLLKELISIMEHHPDCAIVAPRIYDVTAKGLLLNPNDSAYLRLLRKAKILPPCKKRGEKLLEVSEAQGSALLVDIGSFLDAGGFPEHYFMYGEEGCLAKNILWSGKTILWYQDDQNYVLHHHDKTGAVDPWRSYLMGRNKTLEYRENRHRSPILWPMIFGLFLLRRKRNADSAYFRGVQQAKKLLRCHAQAEDFFRDGQHAAQKYNP